MINKWHGVGRLAADPEKRYTQSGKSVAQFTVCCDNGYGDNKKTEFVRCVAWEKSADFVAEYGQKGSLAYVEGTMQTRSWEAQNGEKKYATEIIVNEVKLLSTKQRDTESGGNESAGETVPF